MIKFTKDIPKNKENIDLLLKIGVDSIDTSTITSDKLLAIIYATPNPVETIEFLTDNTYQMKLMHTTPRFSIMYGKLRMLVNIYPLQGRVDFVTLSTKIDDISNTEVITIAQKSISYCDISLWKDVFKSNGANLYHTSDYTKKELLDLVKELALTNLSPEQYTKLFPAKVVTKVDTVDINATDH